MVTSNSLQRTFRIQYGQSSATAFTIDVDGKQYLITAKHVLDNLQANDHIDVAFNGGFHRVETRLVGACTDPVDIVVLALNFQLSPAHLLPAGDDDIFFGQDVYFLGFPFGLGTELGEANRFFPLPFIKRATLSSIVGKYPQPRVFFLDGNNNPGFSGGPVLFAPMGGRQSDQRVAAVIAGYRAHSEPVYDGDQRTRFSVQSNTGIIIAYAIAHALDVIRANPIGIVLPAA